MRLDQLVAAVYAAIDVPRAMTDVAALCEHDRYQASGGIHQAAALVAERAGAAGLADVEILRFPADGARHWWTFAAPRSWTPVRASVRAAGVTLSYPDQPYALAANSAPTAPGEHRLPVVRWSAEQRPDPTAALVVLDGPGLPSVLGALVAGGAAGVVTDPLAGRSGRWPGQVGRIELPVASTLFAFSATAEQLAALGRATTAQVRVDVVGGTGTLPVVTGRLPGAGDRELVLCAHLCHPKPSANDNASGVAALLALARAGAALGTGQAVRFVWGPEFVGLAAYLHDVVHTGRASWPAAGVNVDLAGQDQRRCGGPLVVERAADELPSPISAVAERCAALIPPAARSYSAAVPCDTWAWRATPYVGASDHAMLADRPTCCPTVSLGHWPDLANHTSADTLELVDPDELRRTATIAGATIAALRCAPSDVELATDIADTTLSWAATQVLTSLPGPRLRPPEPTWPGGPVLDPWAPDALARLFTHRAAVAAATVRSLRGVGTPPPAVRHAEQWLAGLTSSAGSHQANTTTDTSTATELTGQVLAPTWAGPMNLRHLGECAEPDDQAWLDSVLTRDRGGGYARLLALARGLDGRRSQVEVAWWAALTSELAIPVALASRFLGMLNRCGWAQPVDEAVTGGT